MVFLLVVATLNGAVLRNLIGLWRRLRSGAETSQDVEEALLSRGFINRIAGGRFRSMIKHSWHMYPVGLLMGLGLETASEVTLLALSASSAAGGALSVMAILSLPLLFAAGMSTFDTADSLIMTRLYSWSYRDPARTLFFNIATTAMTVFIAAFIASVYLADVLAEHAGLTFLSGYASMSEQFRVLGLRHRSDLRGHVGQCPGVLEAARPDRGPRVTPIDLGYHGDSEVQPGLVDFAVNVAVPGPPAWLRRELEKALDQVARYPDVAPAVDALARLHGCPAASVLVTNGAAEAFTLIAHARRWRKPLVIHPQFTEPESALQASGYAVTRLILQRDNGFALDPAQVPADADLVFIGNPTNPTSRLHPRASILGLVRPGRLVVVDEAFMDVVGDGRDSVLDDAVHSEGLVVIRSLTKTFGLAGIRAGYLVGGSQVIAECASRNHIGRSTASP